MHPGARQQHRAVLLLLGLCAPVQCCLINASHLVVHKQAGQQHCQAEDLCAVLGRLQDTGQAVANKRSQSTWWMVML
jgi:hypothetical protein